MDKLTRDSVAALWELLWSDEGRGDDEYFSHVINTARAMRAVLDSSGSTVKDVADWIRQDRLEIEGMEDVKTKVEEDQEIAEHFGLATAVHDKHYNRLNVNEAKFILSVTERLSVEKRTLSDKQKKWLFAIARKYGV